MPGLEESFFLAPILCFLSSSITLILLGFLGSIIATLILRFCHHIVAEDTGVFIRTSRGLDTCLNKCYIMISSHL